MNIVIVHTDYTKKTNPNKVMRIQFESIPRDLSRLISIKKNDSRQIARPSKSSTVFPNVKMRRGSDSLRALLWTVVFRVFLLTLEGCPTWHINRLR